MESINFGSKQVNFYIKRSPKRKTVGIMVDTDGVVTVTASSSLKEETLKKVVQKKAKWILSKQHYFSKVRALFPAKEFVSGEEVLFLGKRYRLKVFANGRLPEVTQEGRRFYIGIDQAISANCRRGEVKRLLTEWYRFRADEVIKMRVARYSHKIGVYPKEIKVKNQEKRWGSCSKARILHFNWKIIMAPISIVDYVIVHELCHLKVHNHSIVFWKLLSSVLPDYQLRRKWLRENAPALKI